jgi:tripartite-type tricarboxylate transporter receptor subunit TctC
MGTLGRMRGLITGAACAAALCTAAGAAAQAFPSKPLRYIVTGSPGSGADTLGRLIADSLAQTLGRQIVVENRAGGGSNLAAEIVARAAPDGYTILQNTITQAVNATLYRNLNYDLIRDFATVTQLATGPSVLVVHPSLPVNNVAALVKLAQARPGDLNFGSGGTGTYSFLAMELFKGLARINMLHIPYKGGGAALNAILSGEVSVYFAPVGVAMPNIQERRLRALAVSTARRVPLAPDLPTVAEAGVAGYESNNWYGMVVPAKTPPETVAVLRSAALSVLGNATTARRMQDFGYVPVGNSAEEFTAYIRLEIERLGKIVRALKLQPE